MVLQIVHAHLRALGERVRLRHGEHEGLLVQLTGATAVRRHRQCQDAEVNLAVAHALEHRVGLIFVQHQLEPR